ncbi:MAG: DUF6489 family protein [Kiloniellaceae bacterium]
MKIRIDVDCTPEEARRFFGLPDVAPMQDALMKEIHKRVMGNLEAMDPETILKTWLPLGLQEIEKFQKMFWAQMRKAADEARREPGDEPVS